MKDADDDEEKEEVEGPPSSSPPPPSQIESATTTSSGALLPRAMAAAALVTQAEAAGAEEEEEEEEDFLELSRQLASTSALPEPAGSIASGILLAASAESPVSVRVMSPWSNSAAVPSPPTATSAPTESGSAVAAALLASPLFFVKTTPFTSTPAASSIGERMDSKIWGALPPPETGLMTTRAERGR